MPTEHDHSLSQRKIFPRNLTANAAAVVRGNPANSRPESGVDNTHPGLEFDQRNLDKAFFPGLVFEFQFLHGARLVAINPDQFEVPTELSQADVDGSIYLYYIWGSFGTNPGQKRLVELHRSDGTTDGYEVLRTVHDLEPGRIMVAIATRDPSELALLGNDALGFYATLSSLEKGLEPTPSILRDPDSGRLLAAILVGNRASYIDEYGVISLTAVPPGDLTRSLCAPWQWDFADCGCHYWAANKPDIVIGAEGTGQVLNFQRLRSPAEQGSGGNVDKTQQPPILHEDWTKGQMTQPQMIGGWENLPFVIAERETDQAPALGKVRTQLKWRREKIIDEFRYLASIEHALAVEYLYAFYSLDAPRTLRKGAGAKELDFFTAAQVIRSIAVDEMRHFRWVNEALYRLGAKAHLERATEFKQNDTDEQIRGRFELLPLTRERLQFFIDIEAPSKKVSDEDEKLDGLYTRLLNALGDPDSKIDGILRRRLREIVKLIIDEGHSHFERFGRIQRLLSRYDPKEYLRIDGPPVARPDDPAHVGELRILADWNYLMVLKDVQEAFEHQPGTRNDHVADARRTMYNLDDTGEELAACGFGMPFDLTRFAQIDGAGRVPNVAETLARLNQPGGEQLRRHVQNQLKSFAQKRSDNAR